MMHSKMLIISTFWKILNKRWYLTVLLIHLCVLAYAHALLKASLVGLSNDCIVPSTGDLDS